jgi:hypothetical protein
MRILIALLFFSLSLQAQDYSFTQFWLAPQALNPAYSGLNPMRNEAFLFNSHQEYNFQRQQIAHQLAFNVYWPKNLGARAIYTCGFELQYYDEEGGALYQQLANSQLAVHSAFSYPFASNNSISLAVKALYSLSSPQALGAPADFDMGALQGGQLPVFAAFYPRLDYQLGLIWEHYHPKDAARSLKLGIALKRLNQKELPFQTFSSQESIVPALEFLMHGNLEEVLYEELLFQEHHFRWSQRRLLQPLRGHLLQYQFGLAWQFADHWKLKLYNGLDFQHYRAIEGLASPYPSAIWDLQAGDYWSYMGSLGFEFSNAQNRRVKSPRLLQLLFNYQLGLAAHVPNHYSLSFHYSTYRKAAVRRAGVPTF